MSRESTALLMEGEGPFVGLAGVHVVPGVDFGHMGGGW